MSQKIQNAKLAKLKVRAAVYARYSSDMQSEDSADDQIARIRYRLERAQVRSQKFANQVIELHPNWVLKDEAQSGRLAGRENYETLLNGIRQKAFDVLIVDDLSRLTRSLGSLLGLYEMLKWYEVELISICDGISSEDASAKTFFTMKGMVNDFSNDIHAERVVRGMEIRALNGLSCGDYPYGYDSTPTKFENAKGRPFPSHFKIVVNDKEAQTVRRIFAMYGLGVGFTRIAKALNAEGMPSPGAQYAKPGCTPKWSPRSVQHILQNEKYVGIWRWKKTKLGVHPETRKRASKDRPSLEWVSHLEGKEIREDLRIVDHEAWERVQSILVENKKTPQNFKSQGRWLNKSTVLPDHAFSGLLECGLCCGSFLLVSGKSGGYYGCTSAHKDGVCPNKQMLHISLIEDALCEIVADKLKKPEIYKFAAEQYQRAINSKRSTAPQRLKEIEAEIELVETELQNLLQFVMSGAANETVSAAMKSREDRKTRLLSEGRSLRKSEAKFESVSAEQIGAKIDCLSETIRKRPTDAYPVIRALFPKRIVMAPMGKSVGGRSLYSARGQIVLNKAMAFDFERLVRKNKGEANLLPLLNRDSKNTEFSTHENGVTDGD